MKGIHSYGVNDAKNSRYKTMKKFGDNCLMYREKELIKNTLIIALGQFCPQLFNVILIPILTGFLTVEEYGTYDFILTLVSLLLPIATLQIQSAAFRFLIDERGNFKECKKIISTILCFVFVISCIVIVSFLIFYNSINIISKVLLGLYLYVDILYTLLGQITRGLADNRGFSGGAIILSAIKTICTVMLLLVFKQGLEGVLLSFIIGYIVADVFLVLKGKIYSFISVREISMQTLKKLIQYSWPMVPNNLSSWVLRISDRLVITFFWGLEANAVYAAANNIPNIINVAKGVVVMAWQENASIAVSDKDVTEYYSKMFSEMYSLIAGITALLIGFSPMLFELLIKGSYEDAYAQIPILFMGVFYGCVSAFQGGIYVAHKKTINVGITTLIAAIINLVIDLALVNIVGIYAGSISTLVSYFALFVFRLIDVKKFQKMQYSYHHIISISLFLAVMSFLGTYRSIVLELVNAILGIAFIYVFNKELLKKILINGMKIIKVKN